ncbi:hypothetical protein LCGC14_2814080 [marine sediment metagenome]|uniref:HTH cro/C1-type domain-containing protein n=1 Tax=marine sediment metagenome TaxID=412755 RepID=A0A0F9BAE6_9ZZZZ
MSDEDWLAQRIAHRMQERRKELMLTATDVGRMVGISQAQVSRLENAQQGFRSVTLSKIARALNVNPAYFVVEDKALAKALEHPTFAELVLDQAKQWLERRHR